MRSSLCLYRSLLTGGGSKWNCIPEKKDDVFGRKYKRAKAIGFNKIVRSITPPRAERIGCFFPEGLAETQKIDQKEELNSTSSGQGKNEK